MHIERFAAAALIVCSVLGLGQASTRATPGRGSDDAAKLVGNWTLVKYETFDEAGRPTGRGYDDGRIMYDARGNMAAQLMRKGRPLVTRQSSDTDRLAAAAGYIAY